VLLSRTELLKIKVNHQILKENQIKKSPMKVTGILVKETFDNILSLSGSIEQNEQVEIRSEVSGIVKV
jgi:membrane fusion protein (multidrug efflux system)